MLDINTLRFEVQLNKMDNSQLVLSPLVAEDLLARIETAEKERDALQAKVEEMEKQEPVATVRINAINGNPSVDFVPGHRYLHHNDKLYLAPGAKGEEK